MTHEHIARIMKSSTGLLYPKKFTNQSKFGLKWHALQVQNPSQAFDQLHQAPTEKNKMKETEEKDKVSVTHVTCQELENKNTKINTVQDMSNYT